MGNDESCWVVVPLRANNMLAPDNLLRSCKAAVDEAQGCFRILVIDNSPDALSPRIERLAQEAGVDYLRLPHEQRIGPNQKLDAVRYAMNHIQGRAVILLDDDVRPAAAQLCTIFEALKDYDVVRTLVRFVKPDIFDRIDLAGIYTYNGLSAKKQTWGNIAFRRSSALITGFPSSDVLYDELAIERTFGSDARLKYIDQTELMMESDRDWRVFLNQRVRYAYENMAFPIRFALDLLALFTLLGLLFTIGWVAAAIFAVVVSLVVTGAAYCYEQTIIARFRRPSAWPYAALWYWTYPFCSLWAIFLRIGGGVSFPPHRVRRPV